MSYWVVFAIRAMTGVLAVSIPFAPLNLVQQITITITITSTFEQGVLYPSLHSLISRWAPPDERGKFISALLGGTFGTVVTWPMAGILTEYFGWYSAFYVPAVVAGLVTIVWFALVYDSPAQHPRIDSVEQQYIEKALGDTISKKKVHFHIQP